MAILGRAGCWPLWSAIPILRRSILSATEHLLQGQASATPQMSSICVTASIRFVLSDAQALLAKILIQERDRELTCGGACGGGAPGC